MCIFIQWLCTVIHHLVIVAVCRLCPCCEATHTRYLPRGLDALDNRQADQDPSHQQGQGHLQVQAACVIDGAGDVESLAVPEVSGGRAFLTLRHHDYSSKDEGRGNRIISSSTV